MFVKAITAAAVALSVSSVAYAQAKEQFFPVLVYRTGPYAPNGVPFANGYVDYLKLVNSRDGGIGGVKITFEECETGYATDRGVECYERLKGKGPTGATVVAAALDGHHVRAHREGAGRQDPAGDRRLRPLGVGRRHGVQVELPACWARTGPRPTSWSSTSARRKAGSTSSRARRSR